jgi:Right handed beta helix region
MRRPVVLSALFLLLFVSNLAADNTRSAVSLSGKDDASCAVPDPCRTFAVALNKTVAGGELIVLSSAGYGPFTVDKPVSIICPPAFHAALAPSAGDGITVNAGPTDVVLLRGLFLNGLGTAANGINVMSIGTLRLERLDIERFTGYAVNFPIAGKLVVTDTTAGANGGGVNAKGVDAADKAVATIDHCNFTQDGLGIAVNDFADVSVRDSLVNGSFRGFQCIVHPTVPLHVAIENCSITDNFSGIFAGGTDVGSDASTAIIRVSGSLIAHNHLGMEPQASSQILSRQNNTVVDNDGAETFSGTFAAK